VLAPPYSEPRTKARAWVQNNSIVYYAPWGFSGTDELWYTVSDDIGEPYTGVVSLKPEAQVVVISTSPVGLTPKGSF
jgi:hypothetical protein